jgi:hypothetical protein
VGGDPLPQHEPDGEPADGCTDDECSDQHRTAERSAAVGRRWSAGGAGPVVRFF